jgi:hypothetical protein
MVIHLHAYHRGRRKPTLSATFRKGGGTLNGAAPMGGGTMTFDETLEHIDRALKAKENQRAAMADRPPSTKQLFALARGQAVLNTRAGKVKMPVFSIQRDEIDA